MTIDSKETTDNPDDFNKDIFDVRVLGGGCIGSIACVGCGAILCAEGSSCFCTGNYDCPRCGLSVRRDKF